MMPCRGEGNRRSGVALTMRHRLQCLSSYWVNGLMKGHEHPAYTPVKSMTPFTLCTARRNARIVSAVLATAIPSVRLSVCQSVTRRYCVKTTARIARCSLHCQIAKCVKFSRNKKKYSRGTTLSPWNLGSNWPTPFKTQWVLTRFAL